MSASAIACPKCGGTVAVIARRAYCLAPRGCTTFFTLDRNGDWREPWPTPRPSLAIGARP